MFDYLVDEFGLRLASEVFWLGAGALAALSARLWRLSVRRRTLRKAFGKNIQIADDISFYLPLWRVKDGDRSVPRFVKTSADGVSREFYGPDRTFAAEDAGAAFAVGQAFAQFFSRPILIQPDTDKLRTDTTNILIGTGVANAHVRAIMDRYRAAAPDELPVDFIDVDEHDANHLAQEIINSDTGERYGFNGVVDHAVILRLPKIEDGVGFNFIVGGIDASGTEAAGRMLRRRWRRFARYKGPVALVLCLERGAPESRRGVAWIYRRGGKWVTKPARGVVKQ